MKHIHLSDFKQQKPLLLTNIQEGFDHYPHAILSAAPDQYLELLRQLIVLNGNSHSFVDCYFGNLPTERQTGLLSLLPQNWQQTLQGYHFTSETIYWRIDGADDPALEILAFLSAREYLFSTFYFTRYPCTLWTNFALTYPLFFSNKKSQLFYKAIITNLL